MKKLFGVIVVMVFTIVLAGCGCSKSYDVECTNSLDESGMKYDVKVGAKLDGKNVSEVTMEMTFEDEETAKTMYEVLKTSDEVEYKLDKKTISATQPVSSISEEGDDISKETFIKNLEEEGYKCK